MSIGERKKHKRINFKNKQKSKQNPRKHAKPLKVKKKSKNVNKAKLNFRKLTLSYEHGFAKRFKFLARNLY